ncbi:SRPBCC domain-containing protein [Planctomycetota bacterium]|nr:SRPBCC domain-containing protein [Planctomycetota bacterium]
MHYTTLTSVLLLLTVSVVGAQDAAPMPEERESVQPKEATADSDLARLKLGEFWYAMHTPDGGTEGYARLKFSETKQGGLHCDWELHITYSGGNYEEARQISFGKDFGLTWSRMESSGTVILGAREGNVMVGKAGVDDLRVEVETDAITGMGFVLAACMEQAEDATISRTEYNEAGGFKNLGKATITCVGQEDVELDEGKIKAWRYDLKRKEMEKALPIWVNEAREIVQVDWGTNNLMKLRRENTEPLFKPKPPLFTTVEPEDKTKLELTADFAGFELDEMWELWATGEGLAKWWPQEAVVEGNVGGKYAPTWKDKEGEILWQLQGVIEVWEPNKKLGFTWKWNTDPKETPTLHVLIEFKKVEGGVNLTITHSKFDPENDDQLNRTSLNQGWESFCSKLATLKK